MSIVPSEVQYVKPAELPPSTRCISLVSVPQQGQTFSEGQQITFPLQQYGHIVPSSLVVSYTIAYTAGAVANGILGIPAYAPISRLDVAINSTTVESISNYGALCTMLVNAKMTPAQKLGLSKPFGLTCGSGTATLQNADSFTGVLSATNTLRVSAPLGCIYSSAEKYFPLSMGDHRITLTIDSLANFTYGTSLTSFSITNVQLNYDIITFDEATERALLGQADGAGDIYLKSQSYQISSAPVASGFSGYLEQPFACSLTSIKSLFSLFTSAVGNRNFASYDITAGAGQISWTVAGKNYPETAIDMLNRPQYATIEFLSAIYGTKDPIMGVHTSMSGANWSAVDADPADDSKINHAKSYFGCNVERLSGGSNSVMLSGVSSLNSNVTLKLQVNTATLALLNSMLIINHDLIIKFNPSMRQITVLK